MDLYRQYPHITCIALMGGDANIDDIIEIGFSRHFSSMMLPSVKLAWYSGLEYIENEEQHDKIVGLFDYIKMGPYIEEKGPLNNPNTNQRMYETFHSSQETRTRDITHKFWKTYEGY